MTRGSHLLTDVELEDALRDLQLSQADSDKLNELSSLVNLAQIHVQRSGWHAAIASLTLAEELASSLGAVALKLEILDSLGRALRMNGEMTNALEAFSRAGALANDLDNERAVAVALVNQGAVWRLLGDSDRARELLVRSIKLLERDASDMPGEIATAYAHLAGAEAKRKDFSAAVDAFDESLLYARQASDWLLEARVLRWLGWIMQIQHEWLQAIDLFGQSLALMRAHAEGEENNPELRELLLDLAKSHEVLGQDAEAESLRRLARHSAP
ncbi:MAG: tetratricopeptide repeat protein [Actinomycetota bacterium]|nr:tetratricopeptide repeat protein [Actinomycetota bacterium]